jgi:hypothetical protein
MPNKVLEGVHGYPTRAERARKKGFPQNGSRKGCPERDPEKRFPERAPLTHNNND